MEECLIVVRYQHTFQYSCCCWIENSIYLHEYNYKQDNHYKLGFGHKFNGKPWETLNLYCWEYISISGFEIGYSVNLIFQFYEKEI